VTALNPDYAAFAAAYEAGRAQPVWTVRIDDLETPVAALAKLGPERPGAMLLESVEGGETRGRYSIIALAPDRVLKLDGPDALIGAAGPDGFVGFTKVPGAPLDVLRAEITAAQLDWPAELPPPAAGLFGYLTYETVGYVEKITPRAPDPLGAPTGILVRPTVVCVFDGVRQEVVIVTPVRPEAGVSARAAWEAARARIGAVEATLNGPPAAVAAASTSHAPEPQPVANMTPEAFMAGVEMAKTYLRAGDIFQVVPSQRFSVPFAHSPFALYRALRRINPSPFLYLVQMDGFAIVGSSPEILVRLRDRIVTVRPIAGTRPRGATPAQDRANEEELLADPKERAEHLMLLDLGRNDVGRVAALRRGGNDGQAGVRVTASFFVERYSHVMHIVSNVEGRAADDVDAVDALLAGFPAGTVSGAPKVRAMEIISELEPPGRGVYAGAVGYFGANGDMDMCIALRTGVVQDGMLHVQAGAGIVLASDPASEHAECVHKARALFRAAAEAARFAEDRS
jgi:anthranilate synthase component 1